MCACVYVGGGSVADLRKLSLLQKPCAAATDRRQRVSSDSVWTDRDRYGMRQKETVRGRPSSGFYEGNRGRQVLPAPTIYICSLRVSLSLSRADGEAEPST